MKNNPPFHLISIDPSISSLGTAFHDYKGSLEEACLLTNTNSTSMPWQERAEFMARATAEFWWRRLTMNRIAYGALIVVIEMPENWFGERGMQSKDSEAIQKLYFFTGMLIKSLSICLTYVHQILLVTPTRWKGQVPKPVMVQRAFKYLKKQDFQWPEGGMSDDIAEAILLGKYTLEKGEQDESDESSVRFPESHFVTVCRRKVPSSHEAGPNMGTMPRMFDIRGILIESCCR